MNGIEKNWVPFELPTGELAIVYKQVPRTIINVGTAEGWTVSDVPMKPKGESCSISCRTGPLRYSATRYIEFVGGHVRTMYRNTRYWFGALVFEASPPFKVVAWTQEPLVWASEASPTIFNPIPRGGHPVCITLRLALMLDNGDADRRSCGVNDSPTSHC